MEPAVTAEKQEPNEVATSPQQASAQTTTLQQHQQLEVGIQKTVSLLVQHKSRDIHHGDFDRSDCGEQAKRRRLTLSQERWSRKQRGEYDSDDDGYGYDDGGYNDYDNDDEQEYGLYSSSVGNSSFSSKWAGRLASRSLNNSQAKRTTVVPVDCDCGRPDKMSGGVHVCRYFGSYHCDAGGCGNRWTSAWTWKGEKQACRSCNVESFPVQKDALEAGLGRGVGGGGMHDQERCSRCLKLGYACSGSF
jgi:hypothetical protein